MSSQPTESSSRLPRKQKKLLKKQETTSQEVSKQRPPRRHLTALPSQTERPYRDETSKEKRKPSPRRPARSVVYTQLALRFIEIDPVLFMKSMDRRRSLKRLSYEILAGPMRFEVATYDWLEPYSLIEQMIAQQVRRPIVPRKQVSSKPKLTQAQEVQRINTPQPPRMAVVRTNRKTRSKGAPRKVSRAIDRTDHDTIKGRLEEFIRTSPELIDACIAGSFDFNDERVVTFFNELRSSQVLARPGKLKTVAKAILPEIQSDLITPGSSTPSQRSLIPGVIVASSQPAIKPVSTEDGHEPLPPRIKALLDRAAPDSTTSTMHGIPLDEAALDREKRALAYLATLPRVN